MQNASGESTDIALRIAAATATRRRRPDYPSEVRALLDAARKVIDDNGTEARARVADIVAAAGLSNDAFYRHFVSKDALVAALIEDGAERVARSLAQRMGEEATPEERVRRWAIGMLAQAEGREAALTLAVLSNSSTLNSALPSGSRGSRTPFAELLRPPFAQLGSENPTLDADLATDAVLGNIAMHTRNRTKPTAAETDHVVRFCLALPVINRMGIK